jgi:predicted GIY-YIG superfamily endonuclease
VRVRLGTPAFAWNPDWVHTWPNEGSVALRELNLLLRRVPSYGWQAIMFYTYILQSLTEPRQRYVGHTADLRTRVAEHNAAKCSHTSKFLPWKVKVCIAFETIEQAQHFERYLKSGSGRAFANRHFWSSAGATDS